MKNLISLGNSPNNEESIKQSALDRIEALQKQGKTLPEISLIIAAETQELQEFSKSIDQHLKLSRNGNID